MCIRDRSLFTSLKERFFVILSNNSSTVEGRVEQYFQLGQYYDDGSSFDWFFGIKLKESYLTYDTFYLQIFENHGIFGILGVILVFWILGNLLMQSLERYKQVYNLRTVMIVHLVIGWFFTNVGFGFFANSFATKFPFNAFFALIIGLTLSILVHDFNLHLKVQPKNRINKIH